MKIFLDRLAVVLILCLSLSAAAFAQLDKAKLDRLKRELESRGGGLVSDLTSRRMTRAANELQAERYDRAIELLESLVEATKSNRYESGLALQMLGVTYVQREQIPKGIQMLEEALAIDALPYEPTMNIYYTLAQIYLATEEYPKAKLKLQEWFYLARQVTPEAQILMGAVYAQEENYKKALEYVEKALASTKEPQEAWLSFAAGLYYQADNLPKAAQMFEQLTRMNPKEKRYWRQLSGIYITIDKEDQALSAMVMAQKMDLLSEDTDYFTLCSLYNYNAIPVNCARLIDQMVKDGKFENRDRALLLVTQAWVQAREPLKAVGYLREQAERKNDGKFDAQRGYIYYQLHRWKEAASAFSEALGRGELEESRRGDVLLSLGIAQYQQKQFTQAFETFTKAQALEDHRTSANAWLSEIQSKM
jgi:tetratricopeptide (TPR) repeat protein